MEQKNSMESLRKLRKHAIIRLLFSFEMSFHISQNFVQRCMAAAVGASQILLFVSCVLFCGSEFYSIVLIFEIFSK